MNSGFIGKGVWFTKGRQMLERSFQKRERLCIHRSHACSCTSLALIVVHHRSHSQAPCVHRRSCLHLACTSPALIVPHRRSRSQAPCAHPRSHAIENVLRSSSLIVAQARHSSTLKLENALRSSSLLLATALHSSLIGVHRRSCYHASCAHPCSCLAHARR